MFCTRLLENTYRNNFCNDVFSFKVALSSTKLILTLFLSLNYCASEI